MKDNYGREITSLRLSLTQRCNLRCFYCHNEGQERSQSEIGVEEIDSILRVASTIGIKKLKLTGGEPLLHQDIVEIVRRASKYMDEVSMVTNGTLLSQYAATLKEAGLHRVNIDLPSLDPVNYRNITGKALLPQVLQGIKASAEAGFSLIKINMVALKGTNETEIESMAEFCLGYKAVLQLIELEAPKEQAEGGFYHRYHFNLVPLERELQQRAIRVETREIQNRKKYFVPFGGEVAVIEIVRSMHNSEFCRYCSRIRLTSDGKLKPCLWSNDGLVDVTGLIQQGDDSTIKQAFITTIMEKKPYWQ